MEDLYLTAIEAEISPLDFWEYTVGEILDLIFKNANKRQNEAKNRYSEYYLLAELIVEDIAVAFSGDSSALPMPWERFPRMFQKEKDKYEEESRKRDLEIYKQNMIAYAERHNARIGGVKNGS